MDEEWIQEQMERLGVTRDELAKMVRKAYLEVSPPIDNYLAELFYPGEAAGLEEIGPPLQFAHGFDLDALVEHLGYRIPIYICESEEMPAADDDGKPVFWVMVIGPDFMVELHPSLEEVFLSRVDESRFRPIILDELDWFKRYAENMQRDWNEAPADEPRFIRTSKPVYFD